MIRIIIIERKDNIPKNIFLNFEKTSKIKCEKKREKTKINNPFKIMKKSK
jgi:hypothetical protein